MLQVGGGVFIVLSLQLFNQYRSETNLLLSKLNNYTNFFSNSFKFSNNRFMNITRPSNKYIEELKVLKSLNNYFDTVSKANVQAP